MRRKTLIFLLLFVIVFVVAEVPRLSFPQREGAADSVATDTLQKLDTLKNAAKPAKAEKADSAEDRAPLDTVKAVADTAAMDSLQKAIWLHNKVIDDSLAADSLNRQRKNGIDAPVEYTANDSMTYEGENGVAWLYGDAHVTYQNMDLQSDKISMSMDSSLVHAMGSKDSTGKKKGSPIFKMGSDTYENDTMSFNFKTKKGLIKDVYTKQEDGYMTSEISKRGANGDMFLYHGRYTTCDLPHPDFYIAMSRAKVRPGKDVVFGPAYLVVADVPLPLAIPYGFFPFTSSYTSGFIMPTYGDESTRGFYLRDGGYYFAISDKMDLKLIGEIYTKGSWGISAASNYRKRYRYNGQFYFSYLSTVTGDKNIDQTKETSFKLQWSHSQDPKANPYSQLRASVNFTTTGYDESNLTSMYNPQARTQSLRTSSVSWSTGFSSIGMSLSSSMNLNQSVRDSTIGLTLPDLNISIARFYPFKRKKMAGKEKWYEKISVQYTGSMSNRIDTKENKLLHSNLAKDWQNGMEHRIPIQANFMLFDVININPSFNFNDKMVFKKFKRSWDETTQKEKIDTLTGFYNMYDWNLSVNATTKLYGMYIPNRKLFGNKINAVRHVLTPSIGFTYTPSFGSSRYGYYDTYQKTDAKGNVTLVEYSPYSGTMYSPPSKNMSGNINMSLSNNLEMKYLNRDDSLVKVSLIDELSASMSYDVAAEERPWSDLNASLRLKLTKSYTFNLNTTFATYAYEADSVGATPYVGTRTEYSKGRFGRFQGMSQNLSYTLNENKVANFIKWLKGERPDKDKDKDANNGNTDEYDTGMETNMDNALEAGKHGAERDESSMAETDEDGYMPFTMPWSLSIGYGITMRENTDASKFNYDTMRYPYKFTQNLNFSGNIRLSEGWNISFSSGYDFEEHKLSMTTASLSRDLHCFNMSCSVVLTPYTSYNFSFRCNAATLTDALKYDKRSSYSNAVQWY